MEDYIIVLILILVILAAVATLWKRRGRKGCCGSSITHKPRKKKLKNVIDTRVFVVDGMHCQNCANRVTEIINDIPGLAGVVDLKKGTVTVSYERQVPDTLIGERLQRHGYSIAQNS